MTQPLCKPYLSIPGNLPEITAAWAFGMQKIRTADRVCVLWGAVVHPRKLNILRKARQVDHLRAFALPTRPYLW